MKNILRFKIITSTSLIENIVLYKGPLAIKAIILRLLSGYFDCHYALQRCWTVRALSSLYNISFCS